MLPNGGAERDAPPAARPALVCEWVKPVQYPNSSDFDLEGQRNGRRRMLLWDGTHSGTNKVPRGRIELPTPGFSDLCSTD
jgi:hypothetical protein